MPSTSAIVLAEDAVREVLCTQWAGEPALRLDSPPGAGKTGVAERLAMQSMALMGERCQLVTQTNEQAFDLVVGSAAGIGDTSSRSSPGVGCLYPTT